MFGLNDLGDKYCIWVTGVGNTIYCDWWGDIGYKYCRLLVADGIDKLLIGWIWLVWGLIDETGL